MYVHIVSFKIAPGEDTTFIELQKFEETVEAKPAGLDHYHIFKDLNEDNRYFLLEYWKDREAKEIMEASKGFQFFKKFRQMIVEKKFESYDCEVII